MGELCLTDEERLSVEARTREQYQNQEWYQARRYRITGSKCDTTEENSSTSEDLFVPKALLQPS